MITEDRLVHGLLRHERWAQNELHSICYDKIIGSMIKSYGYENKNLIEEAANDGLLKVMSRIEQYSGVGSLISWSISIAKNCYLNSYKNRNKCMVKGEMVDKPKTTSISVYHHNISTMSDPGAAIDLQIAISHIADTLESKEMELVMKHAYGYSYVELAEEHGVTAPTIRERIKKSLGKIHHMELCYVN